MRILFAAIFILVSSYAHADITTGLKGWWKLEEGSGTAPVDSSGSSATISFSGSPSWTTGKIGSYALSFDGTSAFAKTAANSAFDGWTAWSVSCWVYTTTLVGVPSDNRRSAVARFTNSLSNGWIIEMQQVGATAHMSAEYVTRETVEDDPSSIRANGPDISINTWYHIVAVYNAGGTKQLVLYTNGVAGTASLANALSEPDLSAVGIAIGSRRALTADNPWSGYVDDVRVYNRALSSTDVGELYATANLEGASSNLAGWWKFNDGSGYNVTDSSGNSNTGIIKAYPRWTTWPGSNGALEFNEGCEFVRIPYSSTLKTGTMTISVWMEVKDLLRTNMGIFGWGRGDYPTAGCTDNYYTFINNNSAYTLYGRTQAAYINDAGVNQQPYTSVAPNGTFPVGGWNHHVVVYDADTDVITEYKNGAAVGSLSATGGIQNCGSMTTMGSQEDYCNTTAIRGFSGKMADYRVYTRALSATEIAALYGTTRPLVVDVTAPDAPTGLTATASGDNISITLNWTGVSDNAGGAGLGGYTIARSTSSGGTYVDLASVPAGTTTWTDYRNYQSPNYSWTSTLAASTAYYYKVKAFDKSFPANFSAYSTNATATTIAAPATTYTLTVNILGTFTSQAVTNTDWSVSCTSGTCTYTGITSGAAILLDPFTFMMGMRQNSATSGFNGWSGSGCQGTGPCLVRMNGNQAVTAYYGSSYPPDSSNKRTLFRR